MSKQEVVPGGSGKKLLWRLKKSIKSIEELLSLGLSLTHGQTIHL